MASSTYGSNCSNISKKSSHGKYSGSTSSNSSLTSSFSLGGGLKYHFIGRPRSRLIQDVCLSHLKIHLNPLPFPSLNRNSNQKHKSSFSRPEKKRQNHLIYNYNKSMMHGRTINLPSELE